jgi:hypothetical protein
MALQLSTIRTQFGEYKKDISDVSADLFLNWMNDLANYIYREILKAEPEKFMTELSFNQTTNSKVLPAGFKNLISENSGFFYNDSNGFITDRRLPITHPGSQDIGFYLSGNSAIFTPPSWGISQSFTLRYLPKRTQFITATDYFTVDLLSTGTEIITDAEEYMDYLIKALDVLYTQWDEDVNQEGLSDIRYTRVLDELLENIRPLPKAYYLDDFSTIY